MRARPVPKPPRAAQEVHARDVSRTAGLARGKPPQSKPQGKLQTTFGFHDSDTTSAHGEEEEAEDDTPEPCAQDEDARVDELLDRLNQLAGMASKASRFDHQSCTRSDSADAHNDVQAVLQGRSSRVPSIVHLQVPVPNDIPLGPRSGSMSSDVISSRATSDSEGDGLSTPRLEGEDVSTPRQAGRKTRRRIDSRTVIQMIEAMTRKMYDAASGGRNSWGRQRFDSSFRRSMSMRLQPPFMEALDSDPQQAATGEPPEEQAAEIALLKRELEEKTQQVKAEGEMREREADRFRALLAIQESQLEKFRRREAASRSEDFPLPRQGQWIAASPSMSDVRSASCSSQSPPSNQAAAGEPRCEPSAVGPSAPKHMFDDALLGWLAEGVVKTCSASETTTTTAATTGSREPGIAGQGIVEDVPSLKQTASGGVGRREPPWNARQQDCIHDVAEDGDAGKEKWDKAAAVRPVGDGLASLEDIVDMLGSLKSNAEQLAVHESTFADRIRQAPDSAHRRLLEKQQKDLVDSLLGVVNRLTDGLRHKRERRKSTSSLPGGDSCPSHAREPVASPVRSGLARVNSESLPTLALVTPRRPPPHLGPAALTSAFAPVASPPCSARMAHTSPVDVGSTFSAGALTPFRTAAGLASPLVAPPPANLMAVPLCDGAAKKHTSSDSALTTASRNSGRRYHPQQLESSPSVSSTPVAPFTSSTFLLASGVPRATPRGAVGTVQLQPPGMAACTPRGATPARPANPTPVSNFPFVARSCSPPPSPRWHVRQTLPAHVQLVRQTAVTAAAPSAPITGAPGGPVGTPKAPPTPPAVFAPSWSPPSVGSVAAAGLPVAGASYWSPPRVEAGLAQAAEAVEKTPRTAAGHSSLAAATATASACTQVAVQQPGAQCAAPSPANPRNTWPQMGLATRPATQRSTAPL